MTSTTLEPSVPNAAEEQRLDEQIQRLLGVSPADRDPSEWKLLREMCRLEMLHPNEFVVYRSVWEETDTGPVMVRREVLFHSAIADEAQSWFNQFYHRVSFEERYGVFMTCVEPSNSPPFVRG